MTPYSKIILYFVVFLGICATLYGLYSYFISPIPGDTTSVDSMVVRKNAPLLTTSPTVVGKDVSLTRTGAISFLFSLEEIIHHNDEEPVFYSVIKYVDSEDQPVAGVSYNRLTSELVLLLYNVQGEIFTVPITTAAYKTKTSVVIRFMNSNDTSPILANVYINGEYSVSRGIPSQYTPHYSKKYRIVCGDLNGIRSQIQTIRTWSDASGLTDEDIVKVAQDPLVGMS